MFRSIGGIFCLVLLGGLSLCAIQCFADDALEQKLFLVCNSSPSSKFSFASSSTKSQEIPLFETVDEGREVVQYYQKSSELCEQKYEEAFEDLSALLEPEFLQDVCSESAFYALKTYHLSYIHYWTPEASTSELKYMKSNKADKFEEPSESGALKPIPEALRQFFILFAKQINAICRSAITARLKLHLTHRKPFDEFNYYLTRLRHSLNEETLNGLVSTKAIRKPSFEHLGIIDYNGEPLIVETDAKSPLKRLQNVCLLKLRPIYLEVFGTAIRLNNLGYRDRVLTTKLANEFKSNDLITEWYEIISVCELIKDISMDTFGEEDEDADEDYMPVEHLSVSFGQRMKVIDRKLARKEVKRFDKYVKWSVFGKTNKLARIGQRFKTFVVGGNRSRSKEVDEFLEAHEVGNRMGVMIASAAVAIVLTLSLSLIVSG